ncbi:hypothetical protein Cgig2_018298 [Carnegiea gigantea]|uniref:Trichome birefringence-like N-terminal domain-containing protein n=1 Tax=Carnegiea gigantea TaxID=171969 RepID=A0A9Q1QRP0_9CARY|nr:hypothetical protein Cgig2_018298 [Carnegiea gigantea]
MSNTNRWKSQQPQHLIKKLLPYVVYALLPIALFSFYFYPFPRLPQPPAADHFSHVTPAVSTTSPLSYSASPPSRAQGKNVNEILHPASSPAKKESGNGVLSDAKRNEVTSNCDYTNGEWLRDSRDPLYNGSNCGTIKDGQNCMAHGRPDKGYLYWRWKPRDCNLPRFNPQLFLQILKGKHLAFVGDSMARNQLESLLCMLSSFSPPNLVYSEGDDNKFRRWHFPSHYVNISVYWSPFLVKGIEKDGDRDYNELYLDSVDEMWASDLDSIDMVVLSIGHWYLLRAIYHDGDLIVGCHALESLNCTEIGFYNVFGKAFNTALKTIIQRKGFKSNGIDVIVTAFSPHHFEGEWDKLGACPRTEPYKEGEKTVEGMDAEMRRREVEEVTKAKTMLNADDGLPKVRIEALDVTKLALLRPDGHPGPYMYPFPFADGIKEHVQNDCVHWCLPGPIDTWNEVLLDIAKRWHVSSMR